VSVTVILFFMLIAVVFWISSLHDRPDFERRSKAVREAGAREAEVT
jgi:hypothetical protein